VEAPAKGLLDAIFRCIPSAAIIAEDLGTITPDVREVIREFDLPGMKILLFAFGPDLPSNPYIPHNLPRDCILYTGTHDNNTVRGWFEREASPEVKDRLAFYLGREVTPEEVPWELIRLAMMSVANTVIFPMQDLLGLGEEARMTLPASTDGNWAWRLSPDLVTPGLAQALREITEIYGRG
jgi:4-alpha-glucanotransferase